MLCMLSLLSPVCRRGPPPMDFERGGPPPFRGPPPGSAPRFGGPPPLRQEPLAPRPRDFPPGGRENGVRHRSRSPRRAPAPRWDNF